MKLVRYVDSVGSHWVGLFRDGLVWPVSKDQLGPGPDLLLTLATSDEDVQPTGGPLANNEIGILAPIPNPPSIRDFFAFEEHAKTAREGRGLKLHPEWYELPVFYFANPASVVGPNVDIHPPRTSSLDYELEVAGVIGTTASNLDANDPATMGVIAGFTIMNDWSARDIQLREMQLMLGPAKGKDFATSLGPYLVTPDEFPEFATGRPKARMRALVNGKLWSQGELADIYYSWAELLAYASRDTVLRPGDIIGSGTCGTGCILELSLGVEAAHYPFLQPGDRVDLEVDGIGTLTNSIAHDHI